MAWQYAILVNVDVNFVCEISDGPKHVAFNTGTMHLIDKQHTYIEQHPIGSGREGNDSHRWPRRR